MQLEQKNFSLMSRKGCVQNRKNPSQKAFKISRIDINHTRKNQNQFSPSGISHIIPEKDL
jgi:hypothetical protein